MFTEPIPLPPAGTIENVLLALAIVASCFAVLRKAATPRPGADGFATRAEVRSLNDRVEALNHKFDALTDRFDARLEHCGSRLEQLAGEIHRSLNQLEAGLARVDERTRK